jgi:DNA-binding response OmpR family regulator
MSKLKQNKILIVEDESSLLRVLEKKLTSEGYNVVTGKDGEQGLSVALKEHPDLILLDIIMPKMDGVTVLEKLREDDWGKNVPVIMLTNLTDSEKVFKAKDGDVREYLVKTDWKLEDVVGVIKKHLE